MTNIKETLYLFHDQDDNFFVGHFLKMGLVETTDPNLFPRVRIDAGKKEVYFESSANRPKEIGGFGLVQLWKRISRENYSLKKEPFAKAIGAKQLSGDDIVFDMSCGTGKDTLFLLKMNLQVVAFERNPVVHLLLSYYFYELSKIEDFPQKNIELIFGTLDASSTTSRPTVIYFDPMYGKSANAKSAPRKQMVGFRDFLGEDDDYVTFLEKALNMASRRVVLKKPLRGSLDLEDKIHHSIKGKSTRYDVYQIFS